ncbi:DUF2478 domain-containing protein [Roseomonas sp. NAR14]|uniref:DUF2478 domain-containing protein n=1 Tax=Roseomonas acroporae TaxID=2937791 RepID=A0A9X1Y863_9PROT|nr:DUF2478 domain-containing protein [Roseomonas acroporae]MCK8784973.1 DUF2478 domain-containing protein [Roseomonas acroporae]
MDRQGGGARVATIAFDRALEVDAVLASTVAALRRKGFAVGGLMQHFGERLPGGKRSMWLEDIGSGERIRIDQPRGAGAISCTLDLDALARAACHLRDAIRSGADLLVVNRFGISEAEGGGMRAEIAEALCSGMPLLIAVRMDLLPAWGEFLGGTPWCLPAQSHAACAWALEAIEAATAVAI